jgi:hypothetical protein
MTIGKIIFSMGIVGIATCAAAVAADRDAKVTAGRDDRASHGYQLSIAGADGLLSVDCVPNGKCTVIRAKPFARKGTRWVFDYVPSEWAGDPTKFKSFPSFARATSEEIRVTPSGSSSEGHVGTKADRPDVHGTVSPVAPPPPVPQPAR